MKKFLFPSLIFAVVSLASAAHAETAGQSSGGASSQQGGRTTLDFSTSEPLTIAYLSPAFGAVTLGVSPENPLVAAPLYGTPLLSPDFSTTYKTQLYGGEIGMTAGFMNGGSLFDAAPTAGWNFGASVGIAGFYVQAGISDASAQRLTSDPNKGWLAGFGYSTGGLNLRLSYMTAQTLNTNDPDSRTWMIGGIYQLNPRIRVNADAFTGRDPHALSTPVPAATSAAPQGTGARVGVQLRF